MKDKIFLDTNILLYAHTDLDVRKQAIAQNIINSSPCTISTQVLQETGNVLHKKFNQDWGNVRIVLNEIIKNNTVYLNNEDTIIHACEIALKNKYSFYDSLIISAALNSKCDILYTEDLHNSHLINNSLKIINPFS